MTKPGEVIETDDPTKVIPAPQVHPLDELEERRSLYRTIYELLPEVMRLVGGVAKEGETSGGGQNFRFRGIEHVLAKVQPALIELGVTLLPHRTTVVNDERYQARGGAQMRNVQVHTQWRFYGPAGDNVELESLGEGSDAGDKATAKAMSIAQKYALFQALSIPTEDDPDRQVHQRDTPPPPEPEWLAGLVDRISELPDDLAKELSAWGKDRGIGMRWKGVDDGWRETCVAKVEEAEAEAARRKEEAEASPAPAGEGTEGEGTAPAAETAPTTVQTPEELAAEIARIEAAGTQPFTEDEEKGPHSGE